MLIKFYLSRYAASLAIFISIFANTASAATSSDDEGRVPTPVPVYQDPLIIPDNDDGAGAKKKGINPYTVFPSEIIQRIIGYLLSEDRRSLEEVSSGFQLEVLDAEKHMDTDDFPALDINPDRIRSLESLEVDLGRLLRKFSYFRFSDLQDFMVFCTRIYYPSFLQQRRERPRLEVRSLWEILPRYHQFDILTAQDHCPDVTRLLSMTPLTTLRLRFPLTEGSEEDLFNALTASNVTHLMLSGDATDNQIIRIANALNGSKVTYLECPRKDPAQLRQQAVMDAAGNPLAGLFLMLGMEAQANNPISEDVIAALANTLTESNLKVLKLAFNNLGDVGVETLASVLPQSNLTVFDLQSSQIGNDGVAAIAEQIPGSALITLNLQANNIDKDAAIALAEVIPLSKLDTLNLAQCDIAEKGATAIAEALPGSRLNSLFIGETTIGRATIEAFAMSLPESRLTALFLLKSGIGDDDAIILAEALPQSHLLVLSLEHNLIADAGAAAIAAAIPNSKLRSLYLEENNIGRDGKRELLNAYADKDGALELQL